MVMPWTCGNCGGTNGDDTMFCEHCQPDLYEKNHWMKKFP